MTKSLDISRRGITPAIRERVLGGGAFCAYCGYPAIEVDHVVPRARGGGLDDENLAPACYECNRQKSDYTVEEWKSNRLHQGKPWPIPSFVARLQYLFDTGFIPSLDGIDAVREWMAENFKSVRARIVELRDQELDEAVAR